MNRRYFIAALTASALLPLTGCPASTIETDLNTVLTAATTVILDIDPAAAWFSDFQAAVTGLKSAEQSWQGGSSISVVESALNTLASVSAFIPITAPYSSLIAVLVAGIDLVLGLIPGAVPPPAVAHGIAQPNIYRTSARVVIPHRFGRSKAQDFKAAWNLAANSHGLSNATI